MKLVPVMVTVVPALPEVGLMPVIVALLPLTVVAQAAGNAAFSVVTAAEEKLGVAAAISKSA